MRLNIWELRLVQGVSLKILGSEAKGNKTKEMNYSSLIDHCIYFYIKKGLSFNLPSRTDLTSSC